MHYEYKVVPAPAKPRKGPRIKGAEAKFAYSLETVMNEYAGDGWEYQRADILPSEERRGLRSTQTVYRTVLVFRRAVMDQSHGAVAVAEEDVAAAPMHVPEAAPAPVPGSDAEQISEPERNARFSLVGSARRGNPADGARSAPTLSAPHVNDPDAGDPYRGTDPSEDRR
ncbi:MAG: DUF4177 domain-containing protein [Pseudomonadota bacterium]